jgi:hypothetical protein
MDKFLTYTAEQRERAIRETAANPAQLNTVRVRAL